MGYDRGLTAKKHVDPKGCIMDIYIYTHVYIYMYIQTICTYIRKLLYIYRFNDVYIYIYIYL